MLKLLLLGTAGAAGTISRYFLSGWIHQLLAAGFPYGTLVVNICGCLAVGFLGTLAEEKFLIQSQVRTVVLIGFLGGFTTFSSFAYVDVEFVQGWGDHVSRTQRGCECRYLFHWTFDRCLFSAFNLRK